MKILHNIFVSLSFVIGLGSCTNESSHQSQQVIADGNTGGNVIRIAELTVPSTLFPHKITNAIEGLIVSQIYEGLVKINPKDLSIMPGLVESWEIDQKSNTINFHLRKGLKFQGDSSVTSGNNEITSKDVAFTFELLCTDSPENLHFQTVCKDRIVGANDYFKASSKQQKIDLKGFKIVDDYSFSIELLNSPGTFLEILANPVASIISQKAYSLQKENAFIGAGPFVLDQKASTKTHYVLCKNPTYYAKDKDGHVLPYIDSLIVDILPSPEEILEKFEKGNIDFISYVPSGQVSRIVSENIKSFKNPPKYVLNQSAEMMTSYYLFNVNKAPLNNLKLRQAINFAIDKNKIVERVLFGQAFGPAVYGIVPPTFNFYKTNIISGYDFNVEKARTLLKEAGYPDGKGLPEIQLIITSGRSRNSSVAAEIQKQLKTNLNINVTFESVSDSESMEMQLSGKADIYRSGWVADYPSPESFLSVFYGDDLSGEKGKTRYPNTTNYKNKNFDKYFELGRDANNRDSAAASFLKAEQILVNDAPIIPLWYESNCRLMKFRVKNFYSNPMRYFDFSQVKVEDN